MITIRQAAAEDWPAIWSILAPVFRAGETYSFSRDITESEARRVWIDAARATYVALLDKHGIVGTYFIKPNQPGQGSHVCNCGYVVSESARGSGVASAMCEHSQQQAQDLGFRSMQYNLVVSSNEGAVRLWKKHGFHVAGTLPQAFAHPTLGLVDAFVMYKVLIE